MDHLINTLTPAPFNILSYVAVISQILFDVPSSVIFAAMENNEPSFDFRCDTKLSDKDLTQGKCFDQYEKQYNKLGIPVYGFVIVNFSVTLIVCVIYSICVKPTVTKLDNSKGNGDAEKASLIPGHGSSKTLFMAYCCQLVLRFALGILFIILQIKVLYPSNFPSNFVCNLGDDAVNINKPNSPANLTQTQTQIYKCHNQRAAKKTFWIDAVAVVNGIFAVLVFIEIVYILLRARNGKFMENKQFYSDHLWPSRGDVRNAPPGNYRPKRSKHFLETLEKAKKEEKFFRLILSEPFQCQQYARSFQIQDSRDKKEYTVKVSTAPSCTCGDYKRHSGKELCKHIIWVYLYVLHVEETSDLLQQITLSEEKVTEILFTKDAKIILSTDERNDQELQWYLLHEDTGENPRCMARRCDKKIRPGALCFKVKGLEVVDNQKPAEESLFYFCSSRDCIKQFPLNSNLKFPTKVFKGEGVLGSEMDVDNRDGFPLFKFV